MDTNTPTAPTMTPPPGFVLDATTPPEGFKLDAPPPPEGFHLDAPEPPAGFKLDTPSPPTGFVLDAVNPTAPSPLSMSFAPTPPVNTEQGSFDVPRQTTPIDLTQLYPGGDIGQRARLMGDLTTPQLPSGPGMIAEQTAMTSPFKLADLIRKYTLAGKVQQGEEWLGEKILPKKVMDIEKGGQEGIDDAVNFFGTPLGIATLGTGALPKTAQVAISATFAAQMASALPDQFSAMVDAIQKGDLRAAAKYGTGAAANLVFAKTGGEHAIAGLEDLSDRPTPTEPLPKLSTTKPSSDQLVTPPSELTTTVVKTPEDEIIDKINANRFSPSPAVEPPLAAISEHPQAAAALDDFKAAMTKDEPTEPPLSTPPPPPEPTPAPEIAPNPPSVDDDYEDEDYIPKGTFINRRGGGFDVDHYDDDGKRVGRLQIDTYPDTTIKAVDVDEDLQKQGIGELLYKKAKEELLRRGIDSVRGSIEGGGGGPVKLREKIFGKGNTKYYDVGGAEITPEEALKRNKNYEGYVRAETKIVPDQPPSEVRTDKAGQQSLFEPGKTTSDYYNKLAKEQFPSMPDNEIHRLADHLSTTEGIMQSEEHSPQEAIRMATRAFIRHRKTSYESNFDYGFERSENRAAIGKKVDDIYNSWREGYVHPVDVPKIAPTYTPEATGKILDLESEWRRLNNEKTAHISETKRRKQTGIIGEDEARKTARWNRSQRMDSIAKEIERVKKSGQQNLFEPPNAVESPPETPSEPSGDANEPQGKTIQDHLDDLKIDTSGGQLHAFGLIPHTWNTLIDLVKLGVDGGKKVAEAVNDGIDEFKRRFPGLTFDEPNARDHLISRFTGGEDLNTAQKVVAAVDDFKAGLVPASVDKQADDTAGMVREHAANLARETYRWADAAKSAGKMFNKQTPAENLKFIDRMENGAKQPTWELQKVAGALKIGMDHRVKQIQALGNGKLDEVIENYFPHIWTPESVAALKGKTVKPGNLWQRAFSKKPLEGSKSFLKQRTIPTTADGVRLGLDPVSHNPVELALLKYREMDKYIMAQRVMGELKDQGLVKGANAGQQPDGWVPLNDKMFNYKYVAMVDGKPVAHVGNYYAPEPVARILNNYLSPGLSGYPIYDLFRSAGNVLNMAQLGLSAYHLTFTSIDSAVSKLALGIEQLSRGDILKGLGTSAKGLVGSVVTNPIENYLRGSKVLKEYTTPGSVGGDTTKIVDGLIKAGGRVNMDAFYKNSAASQFMKAYQEANKMGMAKNSFGTLMHGMSYPIMQILVPRMKLGIFSDMARYELQKNPTANTREVMGKIWDSVDNRMGQMVYDNLFWHKTLKDTLMASVRSVGWNVGTIRELGGATLDSATLLKRIKAGDPAISHRMAYAISLPILVGTLGAMYQYLNTGKGPQELQDYFMPKTGRTNPDGSPERVIMPSYMKDIIPLEKSFENKGIRGLADRSVKMAVNKIQPVLSVAAQMFQNKDFYGTEIVNHDDSTVKQFEDYVKFLAGSFVPFSARNASRMSAPTFAQSAASFLGVMKPPSELTNTKAMQRMADYFQARNTEGGRTQEEANEYQLKKDLVSQMQQGKDMSGEIQKALVAKEISLPQSKNLNKLNAQRYNPSAFDGRILGFSRLPYEVAKEVFKLGTDEEKSLWRNEFQKKFNSFNKTHP